MESLITPPKKEIRDFKHGAIIPEFNVDHNIP